MKKMVILIIISITSKLMGFFREIVMSYFYGTNSMTDCYLMAISIASICMGWLITISTIHTPIYQEVKEKRSVKNAERFTNQVILIEVILGICGLFILEIIGEKIIFIVAVGFSSIMLKMTFLFFRWAIISTIFSALCQTYISEMNCKGLFIRANITNIILSIIQVLVIFFSGYTKKIELLKYSMPFSSIVQFILLIVLLSVEKRTFKVGKFYRDELKKSAYLLIPIFISTMMDDFNAFIDKMFGSTLDEGCISALNYAHLVKQLFFYIFATSMVTILYPRFSENIAKKERKSFVSFFEKGLEYMTIVYAITMFMLINFAKPITEIIYKRGSFNDKSVALTVQPLIMYATALFPLAIREVFVRAFQAMQNTKITMFVGMVSVAINVVLNCVLVKPLKHMGLALSTSIAAYCTLPLLFYFFRKKFNEINISGYFCLFVKTLFSAAISSFFTQIFFFFLVERITNNLIKLSLLSLTALITVIIYLFMLYILKIDIVRMKITNILNKMKID